MSSSDMPAEANRGARQKAVILGGGFAGLWIGYQLQKEGYQVEILEQDKTPGGILKTITKEGFYFDLGPHIFLEPHVPHYRDLVGDDLRRINGFYGFGFRGKEIPSPISPANLIKTLGVAATIPLTASMVWARAKAAVHRDAPGNVEEILCRRFGARIYRYFFRDYVPKVTGLPCTEVSVDWFTERYRFYQEHNLWKETVRKGLGTLRSAARKRHTEEEGLTLYYPRRGAAMITEALVGRIREQGGCIRLETTVDRVAVASDRVEHVGYTSPEGTGKAQGDIVISTIPVTSLIDRMWPEVPQETRAASTALSFRRLALFFCIVSRPRLSDKIQIYFPEARYPFKRIYEPKNLDPSMGTAQTTGICVEVCFDGKAGSFASVRDEMYESVLGGVAHFYRIRPEEVSLVAAIEIPHAYAIYEKGYERHLGTLARHLIRYDNLVSYGRQGSFRYNHLVDRVIDASGRVMEFLRSGTSKKAFLKDAHPKSEFF
jgi:protoporphyrinogen oxidase